jgi:arylsulfatase A-like enzyme
MSEPNQKPNILFILADDLAIWALGCYGNPEIQTPNLDALAADGLRFTDFYCTSPVCSPARASLLTGKMPSSHGVQDWIRGGNGYADRPVDYLGEHLAYTEILAENGYVCGLSGKWHLGNSPVPQKGCTHWFVYPGGGGSYNDVRMFTPDGPIDTRGYVTDLIADDAIAFMREQVAAGTPFHLNVNFTAPHSPWVDQHPEDLVELYDDCLFATCPQETRHPWIKNHPIEMENTEQNASPDRRVVTTRDQLQGYFAAVTAMDRAIGRLRAELQALAIDRETLIVFMSDNGFNCGHHGIWGKGNATFPQNMYDNSVKVPAIVAQPGSVPAGVVCDTMLSGYDVMPTILDIVGLSAAFPAGLPGASFRAVLEGHSPVAERPVVVYDEFGPTRMIRTRDWKYVHRYPYGPHELFDLANDPGERINLLEDKRIWDAGQQDRQSRAAAMHKELETWFLRYSDPLYDGRVQAITGRGQLDLVGRPGVEAFHPLEAKKDPASSFRSEKL